MSRYFLVLDYDGTDYSGWQIQNNARTVQGELENNLEKILRSKINVVGCGRTDAGVHAKNYHAHFEYEEPIEIDLIYKLNKMLDDDIAIINFYPVSEEEHARYSARRRTYHYYLHGNKSAFDSKHSYYHPYLDRLNWDAIKEACELVMSYSEFFPFCKSRSEVNNMICQLDKVEWTYNKVENTAILEISSNRFLRGMVRLIVGMSINIGNSQLSIKELKAAMDRQERLVKSHSVPPQGLFLDSIEYHR